MKQTAIFAVVCVIGLGIGTAIASYIFFGLITLLGFICLVESMPPLKWFVIRTTGFIDVAIFFATIFATVKLGTLITASLTIAGLGYTMVYAPYVRRISASQKADRRRRRFRRL